MKPKGTGPRGFPMSFETQLFIPTLFGLKQPNLAWQHIMRKRRVLAISRDVTYCKNASRGLSTTAEFFAL